MGIAVYIAIGFKLSVLPNIGLSLAAGLTLRPVGRDWRDNLRWTLVSLGAVIGLLGTFMVILRLYDYSGFGLLSVHSQASSTPADYVHPRPCTADH